MERRASEDYYRALLEGRMADMTPGEHASFVNMLRIRNWVRFNEETKQLRARHEAEAKAAAEAPQKEPPRQFRSIFWKADLSEPDPELNGF